MDNKIGLYISGQPQGRQKLLTDIHAIIMEEDKKVLSRVEQMMGKEMIVYASSGMMKYGLASVKSYMSLHVMPIYAAGNLSAKYKLLLNEANFQKGCINFKLADQMPLDIVRQLIADCTGIDLLKMREDFLTSRKLKRRSKG